MKPLQISAYTATSAMGRGRDAHYAALQSSRSGLQPQSFDVCTLDTYVGAVDGVDQQVVEGTWDCRNNRLALLGLQQDRFAESVAAARTRYGAGRIGVFMGTSTYGVHQTEQAYRARDAEGRLPADYNYVHTHSPYSIAGFVQQTLDLDCLALTISTACSSSAKVFATAQRAMRAGLCDAAVVGGVDSLCLLTLYGFNALQLVSRQACRPADAQRDGISVGEAAGFALVEWPEQAQQKGPLLLGYGESSDAHHMSAPQPEGRGAREAMAAALARAELQPADVDYINLHGTATPANDAAEDQAVFGLFGADTPCSSTKGWSGHTLGAAGILEAALCLLALEHGYAPQSLNTTQLDPQLRSQVLLQSRQQPLRHVLSNSFGFGGSNCSLLFGNLS